MSHKRKVLGKWAVRLFVAEVVYRASLRDPLRRALGIESHGRLAA